MTRKDAIAAAAKSEDETSVFVHGGRASLIDANVDMIVNEMGSEIIRFIHENNLKSKDEVTIYLILEKN